MSPAQATWPARRRFWIVAALLSALFLILYRNAARVWFHMDDFAWLAMPLDLKTEGLWRVLFRPQAQGTVRVFSERLFFLILTSLFGLNALPFKIVVFVTQLLNITLLLAIAQRLTKSLAAASIAVVAYIFNSGLAIPILWISAYNEILWTLVVLGSFYLLLRYIETNDVRFNIAQWVVFLLGFGVLELNVVYPAVAVLYAVCCARAFVRSTLWLFIPSLLFTVAHFALIPPPADPLYQMHFDGALPLTLAKYAGWALGPNQLGELVSADLKMAGLVITLLVALGLALFAWKVRSPLVLFLSGWFVIVVAPVLPLKFHLMDYYVAVAIIGPCILAGWAFACLWRYSGRLGVLAGLLLAAYCWGHFLEYKAGEDWRLRNSRRLRDLVYGTESAYEKHPAGTILLTGVDRDLFAIGFEDMPFRPFGFDHVYLVPGSEAPLLRGEALAGVNKYKITPGEAARVVDSNAALVLSVGRRVTDVTAAYRDVMRAQASTTKQTAVDVGLAGSASLLGEGWHPTENGFRWSGKTAKVRLDIPSGAGLQLIVSGYCPAAVLAGGPVHLSITVNGERVGTAKVSDADRPFEFSFPLPALKASNAEIAVAVDRATVLPGDNRELGLIFGKFTIR